VQRSTDAGVHFTDMTNDTQSPPYGMHPDQHAAVFAPGHPTSGSFGSDGGLVRHQWNLRRSFGRLRHARAHGRESDGLPGVAESYSGADLTLNDGLRTLQFQGVSVAPS